MAPWLRSDSRPVRERGFLYRSLTLTRVTFRAVTSPEDRKTSSGATPNPGGFVRTYLGWALFGAFGIGVAVGIALVAGQLASQPVGITGEPVSATASLSSPPDRNANRSDRANRKRKRDARDGRGQGAVSGAGSAAASGAIVLTPTGSSTSSGNSGSGGGYAGSSDSGSPAPGGSGGSGSGSDYDDRDEYEDDSYEDDDYEDDDYEDDD